MDDAPRGDAETLPRASVGLLERLERLVQDAGSAEWSVLGPQWSELARDLDARWVFEEAVLFPAYAEQGRGPRALVRRLVAEHAAMRQLVDETSRQIRRRSLRPVTQQLLAELLREHAVIASAELDPWIAHDGRDWPRLLRSVPTVSNPPRAG